MTTNGEYTYQELKQYGPQSDNAKAALRFSDKRIYWVIHWPVSNPMANEGEDDNWQFLKPGKEIGRNEVYLRTYKIDPSTETETVYVAAWNKRTITVGNGSDARTKTVATNVTVKKHQITLQRGAPTKQIDLQQHNEPTQITMWLDSCPDRCRWRFVHHSNPFTQSTNIDSEGDYFWSLMQDVVLWTLGGAFLVGFIGKKAIDRAGTGPGWGYAQWILVVGLLAAIGGFAWYKSLAQLVVYAPQIIAGFMVLIFLIVILETYTANVSRALFYQPEVENAISPRGRAGDEEHRAESPEAYDVLWGEVESHKIVSMPDGTTAVVKDGLFAFLARVFGRVARLENIDELEARHKLRNSRWDELFIMHPLAQDVLEYDQEGWEFGVPETDGYYDLALWAAPYLAVAAAAVAIGSAVGIAPLGWVLAGGTVIAMFARPTDGFAHAAPTPFHLRPAWITTVFFAKEVDAADTVKEARKQHASDQAAKEKEVEQRVEETDKTIIEEMHGVEIDRRATRAAEQGPGETAEHKQVLRELQRGEISYAEAERRLGNGQANGHEEREADE